MKIKFLVGLEVIALVITMSISAFAQNNAENQAIIEVVNDPMPAASAKDASQANSQVQSVNTTTTLQPIVQNQPVITQQQPTIYVQKQATTVVEDSPLTESAADKLRKQRIEMEQQTESKIVEKLEEARMKAEQERAQKLLSGLNEEKKEEPKKEEKKEEAPAPVVVPVVAAPLEPVQVVQPIVQEVKVEQPAIEVKAELAKLDEEKKEDKRFYTTFDLGFISYDADNVDTGVGLGVNVGAIFDERFVVEGNFMWTRADVESVTRPGAYDYYTGAYYPTIIRMDQYNFGGTFKYKILKTRFAPYVGASLAYVYRDYQDEQSFGPYYYYGDQSLEASSWAIDMGLLVGADIKLSDNFMIGSEFKYMFNIAYDVSTSNGLQQSKYVYPSFYAEPIEEIGYYGLAISLKYLF